MTDETVVLCGANAYHQKFYFNEQFRNLPKEIRQELQIFCVLFTEDVGGILTLAYDGKGRLQFQVSHAENDFDFDEIGSELKIRELQHNKREFLEKLELYYQVLFGQKGEGEYVTGC